MWNSIIIQEFHQNDSNLVFIVLQINKISWTCDSLSAICYIQRVIIFNKNVFKNRNSQYFYTVHCSIVYLVFVFFWLTFPTYLWNYLHKNHFKQTKRRKVFEPKMREEFNFTRISFSWPRSLRVCVFSLYSCTEAELFCGCGAQRQPIFGKLHSWCEIGERSESQNDNESL